MERDSIRGLIRPDDYVVSNYYFLQMEKVMFITKSESFFEFIYLLARQKSMGNTRILEFRES
jgi:hypothetical protein